MLQINNALFRAGELKIADVDYQNKTVPKLRIKLEPQAEKIWKQYFELIFGKFKLPERIVERKSAFDTYLPELTRNLFQGDLVNSEFLLTLLVDFPQKHVGEILKVGRKDPEADDKRKVYKAFSYDDLTKSYREDFSELIQLIDVNVCPYCGRTFTTTAKKDKKTYIRANQVDHFYPKSLYPYLALSIWNWIPSCASCNNRKKDDPHNLFLYPYKQGMGDDYRFVTHVQNGIGYLVGKPNSEADFEIRLDPMPECIADPSKKKTRTMAEYEIEKLGLNALYASHNSYVCDIFRQRYVFGDAYQDSLVASFPELFKSRADVRALLYMKRIEAESIGQTPLDKLTRDIDYEIDTLLY